MKKNISKLKVNIDNEFIGDVYGWDVVHIRLCIKRENYNFHGKFGGRDAGFLNGLAPMKHNKLKLSLKDNQREH